MNVSTISFIFIFCFNSVYTMAQTSIDGSVIDTLGNPVQQANVYIQSKDKLPIVAFGYTSNRGDFSIILDSIGSFILNISSLSYRTAQIPFTIDNPNSEKLTLESIVLKSQPFNLEEVVVNANVPIMVKKDTITINTDSFTDGTEEVVEDILKKLPGINVNKDGTVTVQGKSVDKIMVEGDDLFERGYKLLTKNLHAGVIDKVEILEHYSDNALLKDIEDSDKVALNITLKNEKKSTLFGNLQLGYGTSQFYENKVNLISFNKKTKYYFLGNLNNIGSDATGDIYQLIYPDIFSSENYIGDGESATNFIGIGENSPNLNEDRFNFNNAELGSINAIYNPTKNLKAKGLFFLTSDEQSSEIRNTEEFFITPETFINTEYHRLRKKNYTLSGKWDAIYNLNPTSQIEYTGRYHSGNFRDDANLLFNTNNLHEDLQTNFIFSDHRITYTKKIQEKRAHQITGRYIFDEKPQSYSIDTLLYGDLFPKAENTTHIVQQSRHRLRYLGLESSYFIDTKNTNINIRAGYENRKNALKSALSIINSENENTLAEDGYTNDLSFLLHDFYIKSKFKYDMKAFSLRIGGEMQQLFVELDSSSANALNIIPSIGLSWHINKKNKLLTSYKYSTRSIPFEQIYEGYILNNFRSFNRGTGSFEQMKGSFFLTSYILGNWSESFLINASLIYNKDSEYLSSKSEIQSNYTLTTPVILHDREFFSTNFTGDKFIDILSCNFKLNGSMSKNTLQNIVNNSPLRTIHLTTYVFGFEIRSAFEGPFNFHFGSNWTTSHVQTLITNKSTENNSFMDVNATISDKVKILMKNEFYHFGNLPYNKSFYLSDLEAHYDLRKNKLKLKFILSNLFDTKSFSNFSVSNTGSYSSTYRLLPRYGLLSIDYRF